MGMKKLEKYVKQNREKMDAVQTSINIESRHRDFIQTHNLNLSEMVRDFLDTVMDTDSPRPRKKSA